MCSVKYKAFQLAGVKPAEDPGHGMAVVHIHSGAARPGNYVLGSRLSTPHYMCAFCMPQLKQAGVTISTDRSAS